MTNKFTATYNGKIIGKRSSANRVYTHAIIVQSDEAARREMAYNYKADKSDRSTFDFYTEIATTGGYVHHAASIGFVKQTDEEVAEAKAAIAGGFDAFVGRLRDKQIAIFEEAKAQGRFQPRVFGWSMSAANAQKMANQAGGINYRHVRVLAIVPAVQS